MKTKEYRLLRDDVAGIIFTDKDCIDYVESIVSLTIGIKREDMALKLISPKIHSNVSLAKSEVDAIYEDDNFIVNIEINYSNGKHVKLKNLRYVYQLILKQMPKGKNKEPLKHIHQININNFDIFQEDEFLYKSVMMETKYHKVRDDNVSIYDINVDKLSRMNYNEFKEGEDSLERLLYIFVNNDSSELDKLYLNDEIMEKVREKASALTEDFLDGLYYDREELKRLDAYDLGIDDGKKQEQIEIAKSMLEDNLDIYIIIKHTKLAREEIELLRK